MDQVFDEFRNKTLALKRHLTQPWGCYSPEEDGGEWMCEEAIVCCKGVCGRWRVSNLFSSSMCKECQQLDAFKHSPFCGT